MRKNMPKPFRHHNFIMCQQHGSCIKTILEGIGNCDALVKNKLTTTFHKLQYFNTWFTVNVVLKCSFQPRLKHRLFSNFSTPFAFC